MHRCCRYLHSARPRAAAADAANAAAAISALLFHVLHHSCLPVLSPTSRIYAWWALLMLLLDLSYTGKLKLARLGSSSGCMHHAADARRQEAPRIFAAVLCIGLPLNLQAAVAVQAASRCDRYHAYSCHPPALLPPPSRLSPQPSCAPCPLRLRRATAWSTGPSSSTSSLVPCLPPTWSSTSPAATLSR